MEVIMIYIVQKTKEVMATDAFKNLRNENLNIYTKIIRRVASSLP